MQHARRHQHHKHHGPAADMAKHASVEALLAGIPTAIVLSLKEMARAKLGEVVRDTVSQGEKAATNAATAALGHASSRLKINLPIVVGAVLVGGALIHGALRGKRRHEERSFKEQEDERRAQRQAGRAH